MYNFEKVAFFPNLKHRYKSNLRCDILQFCNFCNFFLQSETQIWIKLCGVVLCNFANVAIFCNLKHRYRSNYAVWYCAILQIMYFFVIWNTDINQIMPYNIAQFCKFCIFSIWNTDINQIMRCGIVQFCKCCI